MYDRSLAAIDDGSWGKGVAVPGKERIVIAGKYTRIKTLALGDIADVHVGKWINACDTHVIIKVARNVADNDLLQAENKNLMFVLDKMVSKKSVWADCIPGVYESLFLADKGGKRRVNILPYFEGFVTAEDIRFRMPNGVDGRTIVWMWKRLLVLIDWIYKCGVVHGAILPPHVMFYPDNDGDTVRDPRKHSVRLIDWCYSIQHKERTRLSGWIPRYESLYAPEIVKKQPLGPYTDLYMGAQTILHLCGKAVPDPITHHIRKCIDPVVSRRPQDILGYFEDFMKVAKTVYGEPKYHDFNLPGGPATTAI